MTRINTIDREPRVDSKALEINLSRTFARVEIPERFGPLLGAVKGLPGVFENAKELLEELNHPYRNWEYLVEELGRFALSNFPHLLRSPDFPRVASILAGAILDSLENCANPDYCQKAADSLLAFIFKVAQDGPDNVEFLEHAFERMAGLDSEKLFFVAASHRRLKSLHTRFSKGDGQEGVLAAFRNLLAQCLRETYLRWLEHEDPFHWFESHLPQGIWIEGYDKDFEPITHRALRANLKALENLESPIRYKKLPDHREIVEHYRKIPFKVSQRAHSPHRERLKALLFLRLMELSLLSPIHDEVVRGLAPTLTTLLEQEGTGWFMGFLREAFAVLKHSFKNHPEGALSCVRIVGRAVFATKDSDLVEFFLKEVVDLGFRSPSISGVTDNWQVVADPAHLLCVRTWLELIELDPKRAKPLLSALICNLALGGVYIKDSDLFQKDISRLLNSPIRPVYDLVLQLARLFPVYFNEIGAEGLLRDVSTDLDETGQRGDKLIHFLRKQSHVESNNTIMDFMEAIVEFWHDSDREVLRRFLPEDVFSQVEDSGPYVDDLRRIVNTAFRAASPLKTGREFLLGLNAQELASLSDEVGGVDSREKTRLILFHKLYHLLAEKYDLSHGHIEIRLRKAEERGMPGADYLVESLKSDDDFVVLDATLDYLEQLTEIILSDETYSTEEEIFHKRHIAVDIPSIYGTYQERKFDALGLTFRLKNLANTLFEKIIRQENLSFITRATFERIALLMDQFIRALKLEGITSATIERDQGLLNAALERRRFSHSQFLDIFKGFSSAVGHIIEVHFAGLHKEAIIKALKALGSSGVVPIYLRAGEGAGGEEFHHRVAEAFIRDLVARSFGLQHLDNFISSVLHILTRQAVDLPRDAHDLLMSYDPEKVISDIHRPNQASYDTIYLGNKGLNLVKLAGLGLKVPPGFIITTEACRCRKVIEEFPHTLDDLKTRIRKGIRDIQRATGNIYGSHRRPLLVSVRSGSVISMPGMMNTILNVGINEDVVRGLIERTGEPWFAWDSYRRFIQTWGMAHGMPRELFGRIMKKYKKRFGHHKKRQFTEPQIREMVRAYRATVENWGVEIVDSPEAQLFRAIWLAMDSWHSAKASAYREILGISSDWGTGIVVQAMVFGNLNSSSGSGVSVTHNPWTPADRVAVWGDYTTLGQGEDVVAGLVDTLPLSNRQKKDERRQGDSLEDGFPEVYKTLVEVAERLVYKEGWPPQEIEFTFQRDEDEVLYVLQSRNLESLRPSQYTAFIPTENLRSTQMATGIGVSGGALSGRAVFTLDDISRFKSQEPDMPLVLIRSDTVPDDIKEISAADGILTAKGGATSHAAIVASRLGKTCVVGCSSLLVWEEQKRCVIGDSEVRSGDLLSIDGRTGAIYEGRHETRTESFW